MRENIHCGDKIQKTTQNNLEVLSSASDKANLFPENFTKNSNFDDSGISLPVFPSRPYLKLHNISVTPMMVKQVIKNLYFLRHLVLVVFQWWYSKEL